MSTYIIRWQKQYNLSRKYFILRSDDPLFFPLVMEFSAIVLKVWFVKWKRWPVDLDENRLCSATPVFLNSLIQANFTKSYLYRIRIVKYVCILNLVQICKIRHPGNPGPGVHRFCEILHIIQTKHDSNVQIFSMIVYPLYDRILRSSIEDFRSTTYPCGYF